MHIYLCLNIYAHIKRKLCLHMYTSELKIILTMDLGHKNLKAPDSLHILEYSTL